MTLSKNFNTKKRQIKMIDQLRRDRLQMNENNKDIIWPHTFDKFILMLSLFGSVDISRLIMQFLQESNHKDNIEFRELNNKYILSKHKETWHTIMNRIQNLQDVPFPFRVEAAKPSIPELIDIHMKWFYANRIVYVGRDWQKCRNPTDRVKKNKLTKKEHKNRKSFHKYESKRRNKMIQSY